MPTVLESLNTGLHQAMRSDPRVYHLGEDILDPYGGAFKVTRGLSIAFPERVLTTPISEAGIVGVGSGMALRGLRPVVEIMFGDFVTLIADQVINHAAKFRYMYNDQVRVPLVIRTPMGGRRGYGPTHSQTLEKLFLGIPGLRVVAPTALGNPGELLAQSILNTQDPLVFIENKLLYLLPLQDEGSLQEFQIESSGETQDGTSLDSSSSGEELSYPVYRLSLRGAPPPTLTLTTYGYMAELARQAAVRLAYEHEVFVELVVPTQIAPFEIDDLLISLRKTKRLVTIEEGSRPLGWGAEIAALAAESLGPELQAVRRVAAQNIPIPASQPLEAGVLPGVEAIMTAALETAGAPASRAPKHTS
jgi:pyruvate/2-oxoglutarate/acetoin dehydrogenase E1 component